MMKIKDILNDCEAQGYSSVFTRSIKNNIISMQLHNLNNSKVRLETEDFF